MQKFLRNLLNKLNSFSNRFYRLICNVATREQYERCHKEFQTISAQSTTYDNFFPPWILLKVVKNIKIDIDLTHRLVQKLIQSISFPRLYFDQYMWEYGESPQCGVHISCHLTASIEMPWRKVKLNLMELCD